MKVEWKNCWRIGVSIFLLYLCVHYWTSFTTFLGTVMAAAAPLLIGVPIVATVYRLVQQAVNKKPAIPGGEESDTNETATEGNASKVDS